jgi:hypothetical protein
MLTYSFKLPPMLELISSFDLRVEHGQVHVGEETLRLTIRFGAGVVRP